MVSIQRTTLRNLQWGLLRENVNRCRPQIPATILVFFVSLTVIKVNFMTRLDFMTECTYG